MKHRVDKKILKKYIYFTRTAPAIKREFELDFRAIEGDESDLMVSLPKLRTVDMNDVLEAANIPENLLRAYGNANKPMNQSNLSSVRDVASLLDLIIAKMSSGDIQVAMESLVQLEDVFKKMKTDEEILKRIDQVEIFISTCYICISHVIYLRKCGD